MNIDKLILLFKEYDIYQRGDSILIRMTNRLCIEYRGIIYVGIVDFNECKDRLIDYNVINSSNRSLEPLDR